MGSVHRRSSSRLTVLFAGFFTLFSLIGLCGLPRFFHPLDSHPTFNRSTQGGFFLTIEATDAKFDPDATRAFLESLGGKHVAVVEGVSVQRRPTRQAVHGAFRMYMIDANVFMNWVLGLILGTGGAVARGHARPVGHRRQARAA